VPTTSYVAMAGDEIVMPENAFLMIHDPSGLVVGTAADMREMAGTLDKIAAGMMRGYAAKSGKPEDEIAALMAAETWFDGAEALAAGLATRMAEPVRIAASFDITRFRNAPPALVEAGEPETRRDGPDIVEGANDVAPAPDPAPQPETDDPDGTVPDAATGPDPATIRAEAIAHARAVIDLCRLAGQPQMAGRFLEEDASLEAVRAALLEARAEATPEISPHHPQPGRGAATRPWGDVIARTFKMKG
jgi:ATP-dependent Clp protease, protease subunit